MRSETASARRAIYVRPLARGDSDGLRQMFSRWYQETIYRRFHAPYPRVPWWALGLLLGMGRSRWEFLVATVRDEVVAHVVYVQPGGSSEAGVVIVVADTWQSKSVGQLLLFKLAERARLRGVETFTRAMLGENRHTPGFFPATSSEARYDIKDGARLLRTPLFGEYRTRVSSRRRVRKRGDRSRAKIRVISKGGNYR